MEVWRRPHLRKRVVLRGIVLACITLAGICSTAHAASPPVRLELTLTGLDAALEEAVRSGLTLQQYRDRTVSSAQLLRLVAVGEREITATLEAWGYYDGRITHRTEPRPEGGLHVRFEIALGEPTRVVTREIEVSGGAAEARAVASAVKAFEPDVGARFDHAQYEASKTAIENALSDHGYLSARLTTHRVEVRTQEHRADIKLHWEGGARYHFGPTSFSGGQFPPDFLDRYLAWEEGDEYSSAQVLDMQRRLV